MKFAQLLLGVAIGAAVASAVFLASSDSNATERISKEPVFSEADLESARIEGLATASTKIMIAMRTSRSVKPSVPDAFPPRCFKRLMAPAPHGRRTAGRRQ